jgi:hypothetical protein
MITDPDREENVDTTDNRLIPLDGWERRWIAGSVRGALSLSPLVPPPREESYRLHDLLKKMRDAPRFIEPN